MDETQSMAGLKYIKRLRPLLARLRDEGCARDKAGNRQLLMDQLCGLIVTRFFNPSLESLRDLQAATKLPQVRKRLGCNEMALGSLSEALRVFDSARLLPIIEELLGELPTAVGGESRLSQLGFKPTAVDGTLLKKLPQITQACFATRRDRGWKMHAHFEVLRNVPVLAAVTDASGKGPASEKAVLRRTLEKDRCYITDRGYENFALFNAIVKAGSSYVCRVRNDHQFTSTEVRELSADALAAGVIGDEVGRQGSEKSKRITHPDHPQRRLEVRLVEHPKRGGRRRQGAAQNLVLVTSLLDVPAEIIVLLYRFRWLIELFFRWLKCVLSCRHLISQAANGIEIEMYCALIACLLTQLAAGCDVKPNAWTYKLLCLYAQGWATKEDVLAHLRERIAQAEQQAALKIAR